MKTNVCQGTNPTQALASVTLPRTLTDKQLRFIDEYLVDYNRTQAALRAGYSPKSARYLGAHLHRHPRILEEIERRKQLLSEKMELTEDEILEHQQAIARANMFDYIDAIEKGDMTSISRELGRCIKRLTISDNQFGKRITIELYDKLAALEFLAKTMGMLDKDRGKDEAPFKVLVIGSRPTEGEVNPGDRKGDTPGC